MSTAGAAAALSPYAELSLQPGADAAAVREAFKRLALQVHRLLRPAAVDRG